MSDLENNWVNLCIVIIILLFIFIVIILLFIVIIVTVKQQDKVKIFHCYLRIIPQKSTKPKAGSLKG